MGPKGIGPQNLGVGMAKMSNCGCSQCDCGSSPTKLVGAVAGMVGKALVGKAVEKVAEKASPSKKRGCKKNY